MDVKIHIFLTSALVGGEWSASRLCHFTTGERTPGTNWVGGWVDPCDGLDDVEKKILDPTGTRTPTPWSSSPWPVAIPTALSFLCRRLHLTWLILRPFKMETTYSSETSVDFQLTITLYYITVTVTVPTFTVTFWIYVSISP
jgi:hypothetical protein